MIEIHRAAESEYDACDAFVEASPSGTLFHTTAWLRTTGLPFALYACTSGAKLVGVAAVAERRQYGITVAAQAPLTPYLGIVANVEALKPVTRVSLWKELSTVVARKLQEDYPAVALHLTPQWLDVHGFIWNGFSTGVRYTYTVDLHDLDRTWADMDAKRRNDIRRAEKDGIVVEESSDFAVVRRCVEHSFARQGMEPGFFDQAARAHDVLRAAGRCSAWVARREGSTDPMAVAYVVWDRHRAYYLLGGYDHERAHGGAHALATWTAIRSLAGRGLDVFDFEGSQIPQIELYFRKFGGTLTPYYAVRWESQGARVMNRAAQTALFPRRVAGKLWRRFGPRK